MDERVDAAVTCQFKDQILVYIHQSLLHLPEMVAKRKRKTKKKKISALKTEFKNLTAPHLLHGWHGKLSSRKGKNKKINQRDNKLN